MSVKMAIAKLCACACGGAIIGGGAVHVAESPRPAVVHQIKRPHARPMVRTAHPIRRHVVKSPAATACGPVAMSQVVNMPTAPLPPTGNSDFNSGGNGTPVVIGGSGGFFGGSGGVGGGFFGGSSGSGGTVVITSTSTGGVSTSTGGVSTSTGGTTTTSSTSSSSSSSSSSSTSSGGDHTSTSTSTSTGGSTSTSTGGSTSTSTSTGGSTSTSTSSGGSTGSTGGQPVDVPAPPMFWLFALAVGGLLFGRHIGKKKHQLTNN